MKSKIIIAAIALAIVGSFAFITSEKKEVKEQQVAVEQSENLKGFTKEDTNF